MDHAPRRQVDDEEGVDLPEQEVVGLDEVASPRAVGVVPQEGGPRLPATAFATDAPHVLLDRALADLDADLEELAANALGAPRVDHDEPCRE